MDQSAAPDMAAEAAAAEPAPARKEKKEKKKPPKFTNAAQQLRYYTRKLLSVIYKIAEEVGKELPIPKANMKELLSTELVPQLAEYIAAYVRIVDKAVGPLLDSSDAEKQMVAIAKIVAFASDDNSVEEMVDLIHRVKKVLDSDPDRKRLLLVSIAVVRKITGGIKMQLPPGMAPAPAAAPAPTRP